MSIAKLINEGVEYPLKRIDNDVFSVFGDYELKKKTFMENSEEIEDTIEFEPERDRELTKEKTAFIIPIFSFKSENSKVVLENFEKTKESLCDEDVFVVEMSYLNNDFIIPDSENFIRIQANERHLLWQKERLFNLALDKLPKKYKNVAWVDGDIIFKNQSSLSVMIDEALSEHSAVQLFSDVNWLDEHRQPFRTQKSCILNSRNGWHGYAWAFRREEIEKIGGMFDYHISGNGDLMLNYAFSITGSTKSMPKRTLNECVSMKKKFNKYKDKVSKYFLGTVTCLDLEIDHQYHGDYRTRKYEYRENLLRKYKFNPETDIEIDKNGLYKWKFEREEAKRLFHDIFMYMIK